MTARRRSRRVVVVRRGRWSTTLAPAAVALAAVEQVAAGLWSVETGRRHRLRVPAALTEDCVAALDALGVHVREVGRHAHDGSLFAWRAAS